MTSYSIIIQPYYTFHHVGKGDDNHDSVTFHEQVDDELTTVEDVEVEFASTTDKIKQVFAICNYINVMSMYFGRRIKV